MPLESTVFAEGCEFTRAGVSKLAQCVEEKSTTSEKLSITPPIYPGTSLAGFIT